MHIWNYQHIYYIPNVVYVIEHAEKHKYQSIVEFNVDKDFSFNALLFWNKSFDIYL